jgi:hypothetical protein
MIHDEQLITLTSRENTSLAQLAQISCIDG